MSQFNDTPDRPAVPGASSPQSSVQLPIDDSGAVPSYVSFCRVTGTPEEVILDFGLNPQYLGAPQGQVHVHQRIIASFYTAKRLIQAMQWTLQRYEAAFGVVETDVERRVHAAAIGQTPQ